MKEEEPSIKRWTSSLEEDEDKAAARAILRWLRQNQSVRPFELDQLLMAGNFEEITTIWPKHSIETEQEIDPLVSEYATKARAELFAESWAFYFTGTKLPAAVTKLLEKTISIARDHRRAT